VVKPLNHVTLFVKGQAGVNHDAKPTNHGHEPADVLVAVDDKRMPMMV
jgi:hypothetical protein